MIRIFRNGLFLFFITLWQCASAQQDYFLVELEAFSPGAKEMIAMMEGNSAEDFEAVDLDGVKQKLSDYNGQFVLLWFWSRDDELSSGLIDGLNLMHEIFEDELNMIGLAYDNRAELNDFVANKNIDFSIIPNSLRIAELLYGSELGLGRIFLIDRQGIVRKAIPREFFIENQNSFNQLRILIQQLINEEN